MSLSKCKYAQLGRTQLRGKERRQQDLRLGLLVIVTIVLAYGLVGWIETSL